LLLLPPLPLLLELLLLLLLPLPLLLELLLLPLVAAAEEVAFSVFFLLAGFSLFRESLR
jgi:hypothetical protein